MSPVTCSTTLKQFHSPFPRDVIFGSVGKAFQHKWHGNGYAHPHTETETKQALHWAHLAAENNSNTVTILVMPDKNWYHNPNPRNGPFPNSHIITHFKADTITYEEPTIPPELRNEPRIENHAIQIICIHHKNTSIGTETFAQQMKNIANTLHIPEMVCQIAPPIPPDTPVNRNKKWDKLTYPPPPIPPTTQIPTYLWNINPVQCLPLKYLPQFCYYTDGSFKPPKQINNGDGKKLDMAFTTLSKT